MITGHPWLECVLAGHFTTGLTFPFLLYIWGLFLYIPRISLGRFSSFSFTFHFYWLGCLGVPASVLRSTPTLLSAHQIFVYSCGQLL